jgi:tetratricopeptide (TPR) repeat protein
MKRESLAFLVGGLAFGILFGYGFFHAIANRPDRERVQTAQEAAPSPAGPMAPTQAGGSAAAPMLEEVNALKTALQANPNDLRALTRLANLLHDAGMWSQAATLYERAVRLSPNEPNLLTDLGICYQNLKEYDKALEQFARAQKVSPDHWQSLYNTVVVAGFDLGRLDDAATALKRLEEVNPAAPNLPQLKEALAKAREERASPGRS